MLVALRQSKAVFDPSKIFMDFRFADTTEPNVRGSPLDMQPPTTSKWNAILRLLIHVIHILHDTRFRIGLHKMSVGC